MAVMNQEAYGGTDTEIPNRCPDACQKTLRHMGVQLPPKVPMTYGEHMVYGEYTDVQEEHMDVQGAYRYTGPYGHVGAYEHPLC